MLYHASRLVPGEAARHNVVWVRKENASYIFTAALRTGRLFPLTLRRVLRQSGQPLPLVKYQPPAVGG